jgi:CheY-like chemotaxis protein
LEQYIEETLELFALQAHSKGLELNASFAEDLPTLLKTDTVRLRQIMMNLISNAIKFTNQGEVLIRVECDRYFEQTLPTSAHRDLPQSPIYLRFSIIDTGIGIESANQDKLFKPFSQVDVSTTCRSGGTGLGLAISRQLVELMQGEIGISSPIKNGQGTCFWFRIPFDLQPQPEPLPTNNDQQILAKRRILVIDENQHSRATLRYYLTKVGAEVCEAANMIEAIACLEIGKHIDTALIDWRTTDFNVVTLKHQFANLPLIEILTANRQGEIQTVIDQGFCGYVTKPFKKQRLLKTIVLAFEIEMSSLTHDVPTSSVVVQNHQANHSERELSNLKILLAEDNIVNQKITMTYLSQLGFQADLAEDGEQVLQLMHTKNYDIILIDCLMPLLDGYATTYAIRQLEANALATTGVTEHIIIIAMTANAFKEDRDRCLAAGMDDYLSKPILKQKLKETLEHWMTKIP